MTKEELLHDLEFVADIAWRVVFGASMVGYALLFVASLCT